jgi:hypothetical protein
MNYDNSMYPYRLIPWQHPAHGLLIPSCIPAHALVYGVIYQQPGPAFRPGVFCLWPTPHGGSVPHHDARLCKLCWKGWPQPVSAPPATTPPLVRAVRTAAEAVPETPYVGRRRGGGGGGGGAGAAGGAPPPRGPPPPPPPPGPPPPPPPPPGSPGLPSALGFPRQAGAGAHPRLLPSCAVCVAGHGKGRYMRLRQQHGPPPMTGQGWNSHREYNCAGQQVCVDGPPKPRRSPI